MDRAEIWHIDSHYDVNIRYEKIFENSTSKAGKKEGRR